MVRTDVDRMDARLNQLGASLFFDPVTTARAAEAGVDNVFVLYAGRVGVLGDVTAEQAASALGFFDPGLVADVWGGVAAYGSPSWLATVFGDAMAEAARQRWDGEAGTVVAELGLRVVEGVTPAGMALFTGWRAVARGGEVSAVVHALRELRGDIHIQSVASQGLHPLEAEMVTRGVPGAELHGWKPPYPDPATFAERVAAADATTSARMRAVYERTLDPVELAALADAVDRLAPATP